MVVRLMILGLLRLADTLHGYEIKRIIEEKMGDWTSIAFGSIYFALNKLTEDGFIEKAGEEREGNRPSRCMYRCTVQGETEFIRLVREIWREPQEMRADVDVAVFFLDALPLEEVLEYVGKRIEYQRKVMEGMAEHREETLADPHVNRRAEAIFDHAYLHAVAELRWLEGLYTKLSNGAYT